MENKLEHLAEFQKVLINYHISEHGKKVLKETRLVLLVAPSAGGRNTVINELLKTGNYHFIISDTTRQPRTNNGVLEKNGREYWFRSENEMLADLRKGEFLEAEIIHGQQVSGISIRDLLKAKDENKIPITDVDIGGISNIINAKPDTIAIVLLPPSFEEWQRRLSSRGRLPNDEYNRRMQTAQTIFYRAIQNSAFNFVINDMVQHAAKQVDDIVQGNPDIKIQTQARKLLKQLNEDITEYLGG